VSAACSPGSFAGRTGHGGAVKVTADLAERVDGGTVFRQGTRDGNAGQNERVDLCEWLDQGCPLGE